jgi:hypothetical protein
MVTLYDETVDWLPEKESNLADCQSWKSSCSPSVLSGIIDMLDPQDHSDFFVDDDSDNEAVADSAAEKNYTSHDLEKELRDILGDEYDEAANVEVEVTPTLTSFCWKIRTYSPQSVITLYLLT